MEIDKVKLEPAIYIVATPIGNLKDITLRSLEVLNSVDIIACEDSRVSKKLLDYYSISSKLIVYNDHSKKKVREKIISQVVAGASVALISDAGTPLISDPGYKLVRDAMDAQIKVTTCPGASSVISALTLSSLPTDSFFFGGFLPQNLGQKENFLLPFKGLKSSLVFMDRGSRLASTTQAIKNIFGDVEISVVREITKMYEEVIVKKASDMISYLEENDEVKGELILVINNSKERENDLSEDQLDEVLRDLLTSNTVRSASEIAFLEHGINKKLAYKRLLELKES